MRKLRSEHEGANSARHERPLARVRKQATDGGDDDLPTYVVEGGQDTLSKQEYEALIGKEDRRGEGEGEQQAELKASDDAEKFQNEKDSNVKDDSEPKNESVVAIGRTQKKRNVTAIGGDEKGDDVEVGKKRASNAKKGKKDKKVKLSFDQE